MKNPTATRTLGLIFLLCFGAVGAALVAQYGFHVRPCPWCILQRLIFVVMGSLAALGWLLSRWQFPRAVALALQLPLAVSGLVAAWYQHNVASQMASCDLTWADRFLNHIGIQELWPKVFMITASCADAAGFHLLGQPYEIWSAALFVLLLVASLFALRRP